MGYYSGRYPVHNYGSDAILKAFRDTSLQKSQKNQAITNAILQQAAEGNSPGFKPGSPQYEGISKQFGGQYAQGLAKKGQAAAMQRQVKERKVAFDQGIQLFNGAAAIEKSLGPKAKDTPMYKQFLSEAGKNFSQAFGETLDFNPMLDIKENQEIARTRAEASLGKIMAGLGEDSSEDEFKAAEMAKMSYDKIPGANKDVSAGYATIIDNSRKERAKKTAFERQKKLATHQSALIKARGGETGATFGKIEGQVFQKWINNKDLTPLEQKIVDRKLKGTGKTPGELGEDVKARLRAKIELLEEAQGQPATVEQKWKLIANDPFGLTAPAQQYTTPAEVKKAFKSGALTEEQSRKILQSRFGMK